MPVAFGYSAGDIALAIQLLTKIYKGLKDTGGAASEFQDILESLRGLMLTLQHLETLNRTCTDPSLVIAVQVLSEAALRPIFAFLEEVRKYEPALSSRPTADRFSSGYRKTEWSLRLPKKIKKLKADIALQMEPIHVLLESATLFVQPCEIRIGRSAHALQENSDLASKQMSLLQKDMHNQALEQLKFNERLINAVRTLTATVESSHPPLSLASPNSEKISPSSIIEDGASRLSLQSKVGCDTNAIVVDDNGVFEWRLAGQNLTESLLGILAKLNVLLRCLLLKSPALFLYLREFVSILSRSACLLVQEDIHFEDVLGRHHHLPYEYFSTWELFVPYLKHKLFKQQVGEHYVGAGRFHILNSVHGRIIQKNSMEWSRSVFPGSRLAMSVILHPSKVWSACPRCRASLKEVKEGDNKQTCPACPWERYLGSQNDDDRRFQPHDGPGARLNTIIPSLEDYLNEDEDILVFRTIHALVIPELNEASQHRPNVQQDSIEDMTQNIQGSSMDQRMWDPFSRRAREEYYRQLLVLEQQCKKNLSLVVRQREEEFAKSGSAPPLPNSAAQAL